MEKKNATLIGMSAILLWSMMVGLIRSISQSLGPVGGAATIYTAGALLMLCLTGIPKISRFPRGYLFAGSVLFVLYEVFLSLALGYADSGRQAIEVAMLNYLWPGMTILFVVLFNRQRANVLLMAPGLALALFGVCQVLGGDKGFHLGEMLSNIRTNPVSYGLAFSASVLWAAYCTVTIKTSRGQNGVTLFLLLTALALWGIFLAGDNPPMRWSGGVAIQVAMSAVAVGIGFAAWNIGISQGNVTVLVTSSYFIPILSSALASLLLNTPLSLSFWSGSFMVCGGSLLCWLSTRQKMRLDGTAALRPGRFRN